MTWVYEQSTGKGRNIASGVAALVYVFPAIIMEMSDSAHYTEQNTREYNFYTPDILKRMPRISARYDFNFSNISGPVKHIYTVQFYGSEETGRIEAYLASVGYKRQGDCNIDNVCWQGSDPSATVMIRTLKSEPGVAVSVVYDFS